MSRRIVVYSPGSLLDAGGPVLHLPDKGRTACGRPQGPDWRNDVADVSTDRRMCRQCTKGDR